MEEELIAGSSKSKLIERIITGDCTRSTAMDCPVWICDCSEATEAGHVKVWGLKCIQIFERPRRFAVQLRSSWPSLPHFAEGWKSVMVMGGALDGFTGFYKLCDNEPWHASLNDLGSPTS